MATARVGLIGSGWRAEFFLRVAEALPESFQISAVMIRDTKKGEVFGRTHQVSVVHSLEELLAFSLDYVVLAIARGHVPGMLRALVERGVPVLCETPPGESLEELREIWQVCQKYQGRVRVAEQYPSQPLYAAYAECIRQGLLGQVDTVLLSALHGYHAVAVFRRLLGVGFEHATIYGAGHARRVTETLGREGLIRDGGVQDYTRERLTLAFAQDSLAFYDFSDPPQYHSMIRTRQWNIQGTRGEIDDLTVRYIAEEGEPIVAQMERIDFGINNNHEWSHYGYQLGERVLYRNPFYPARFNDDEVAVATCMRDMAAYLEDGRSGYGLADALQDAYLSLLMRDAVDTGRKLVSETQPWAKEEG